MSQLVGLLALLGAAASGGASHAVEQQVAPQTAAPWQVGVAVGRGLRFNNPFRLPRSLGSTAKSVSLAATYAELASTRWWYGGLGSHHGVRLSATVAVTGIAQWVLTPSYLARFALAEPWEVSVRAGLPLVVAPDTAVAAEVAVGVRLSLSKRLLLECELVGDVFAGAATAQSALTLYPLLSFQLGFSYRFGAS